MLEILICESQKLGFLLKPIQVMIDFEIASKKAFEKVFLGILVKGCLFHFGQSLFRKFVALGLKSYYIDIKDVHEWFKATKKFTAKFTTSRATAAIIFRRVYV